METKLKNIRTYSELSKLPTFEERLEYLRVENIPGEETFGFDRYINQKYYKSKEWESIRNQVIIRDNGCDLGVEGRDINSKIIIHHLNPIDVSDINNNTDFLKNPEYLITVSYGTHNMIHYGKKGFTNLNQIINRTEGDQTPWKKTIF